MQIGSSSDEPCATDTLDGILFYLSINKYSYIKYSLNITNSICETDLICLQEGVSRSPPSDISRLYAKSLRCHHLINIPMSRIQLYSFRSCLFRALRSHHAFLCLLRQSKHWKW